MFTRKTVIVLGAGASCHYGYPTGEALVEAIGKRAASILKTYEHDKLLFLMPDPDQWPKHIMKMDALESFLTDLKTLETKISQTKPLVIDYFLGVNPALADLGKILIAMELLDCEHRNPMPPNMKKDDWLRFVVHQLIIGYDEPADLLKNTVKFVTFNYDLSLEQRLHQALASIEWFSTDNLAEKFVTEDRIYHVYGKLRDFDPTKISKNDVPREDAVRNLSLKIDKAYEASRGLRAIAPSEKAILPEVQRAIDEIKLAEHLYILGYGFDPHNNDLLKLGVRTADEPKKKVVHFTNWENHNKINNQVERVFGFNKNDLAGERYSAQGLRYVTANNNSSTAVYTVCEKSTQKVYKALAYDFDWPD